MLGAARLNVQTYEDVEHDSGATLQALLVVVLVSIASVVGQLISGTDDGVAWAIVNGVIRGVVSWAVWALFAWLIGATILKTEQTEANWGQLARATGFAQTPGIFNVLWFIPVLGAIIYLVALVWTIVCMIVAVRQSLDYTSTLRAFFVILLALIPVAILNAIVLALTGGLEVEETSAMIVNNVLQVFTV
jgi:hypothetical protein